MIREEKVLIDNLEINYKIAGSGPAVLVLHGWGGSSDSWKKVVEVLSNSGFLVIIPDLPGFGKSRTPPKTWGVSEYAECIDNFAKSLNLEKFFLIAHSFGGRISIKFAASHQEKIEALILCASAGIKPKPGLKTKIIYWLSRIGNAVLTPQIFARLKDGLRNVLYIFLRHKDYVKAKGNMRDVIKKVLEEDLTNELSGIKIKTLLIWGENDRLVPVKYAGIFKEKIKDSELVILPKIGHSPHLEIPQELSRLIVNFLKSLQK